VQVIGTAGHVDHGKSTLIKRLTGINPDRLKEEQDREMSIELGFAWFELPNGQEVGIVDVPGHRDFIENMLAGIGGIDATLFVVAADEGVMPQTREHLAILDLLHIPAGVIALTKIDLIQEPEWLDLVEAELREVLADTVLADAPLVRVSARTGAGVDDLIQALQSVLAQHPHRPDLGRPRLPIDRVFSLPGFGTIVTGTLIDGKLSVGDPVQVLPASIEGRIRSLQTHKQAENTALPGGRTAVNISGIHVDQIERGQVLVHPGTYLSSKMVDVWCDLLPDAGDTLRHNTEVKVFLGAAEVMARVRLLGVEELSPGDGAFLQLMLQKPLVTRRGDRFIIRRPSPSATIGGGQVLDSHPQRRYKRFNPERLAALESLLIGSPEDIFLQTAQKLEPASLNDIIKGSGLEADIAKKVADDLFARGILIPLKGDSVILTVDAVDRITGDIQSALSSFHNQNPLRLGMPREQLKSQLGLGAPVFDALISRMAANHILEEFNAKLRIRGHRVTFSDRQQEQIHALMKEFTAQPFSPPTVKQSLEIIDEPLLTALVETGQLIQVDEDVLFQPEIYQQMQAAVVTHIQTHGSITLAELRDKFDTSRKYAVAVLEYLDKTSVTVRRGDVRVLRRPK
jgi:selenocysteine-specific elongation factor